MEKWLNAQVGSSQCCNVCEGLECRTLEVDEKIHETIPSELIIKAGLLAAASLFDVAKQQTCWEGDISSQKPFTYRHQSSDEEPDTPL